MDELSRLINEQRGKALKDLSDSLLLECSFKLEKQIRWERLKLLLDRTNYEDVWDEDLVWLKQNTENQELAEVLLLEVKRIRYISEPLTCSPDDYAMSLLDEILKLGYNHVDVYLLRMENYFGEANYGLVLKDSEKALSSTNDPDKILEIECLRALALSYKKDYEDVLTLSEELSKKYKKQEFEGHFETMSGIKTEVLCRCAIALEYGQFESLWDNREKILKMVIFFRSLLTDLDLRRFQTMHPRFENIIQNLLNSK